MTSRANIARASARAHWYSSQSVSGFRSAAFQYARSSTCSQTPGAQLCRRSSERISHPARTRAMLRRLMIAASLSFVNFALKRCSAASRWLCPRRYQVRHGGSATCCSRVACQPAGPAALQFRRPRRQGRAPIRVKVVDVKRECSAKLMPGHLRFGQIHGDLRDAGEQGIVIIVDLSTDAFQPGCEP